MAENTGRILELGRWVPSTAARQARHWRIPGDGLTVAVNISAVPFRHRDLADTVRDVLQREGVPAQRPELALTGRIDNLFDRKYQTAWGYNQPGIGAYLGLVWNQKR